ncbi:MAG: VOC family protein [Alphaproteobacteria bacterium]|nr:VOC family protein [Alphaproteobacteria bacterium]
MGNPFVHIELTSTDADKAKTFYKSLFDWKLEDMPMEDGMNYTMINVGEGTGGGIMKSPKPDMPSAWIPYVMVDDVEAATKKAKTLGGTIIKDKTAVKDMGWFSIIKDPSGAVLGLWMLNMENKENIEMMKKKKECCSCC